MTNLSPKHIQILKNKKNSKANKLFLAGSLSSVLAACDFESFAGFGGLRNSTDNNVLTNGDGIRVHSTPTGGTISGGNGDDVMRSAANITITKGGAGKDKIVLLGVTNGGDYVDNDFKNPSGTGKDISKVVTAAIANSNSKSDVVNGKLIDGQDDGAILFTFGVMDLSKVGLVNLTQIEIDNQVTITAQTLANLINDTTDGLNELGGVRDAKLIIANDNANILVNFAHVNFNNISEITIPKGVTLRVDQQDLADVKVIKGEGILQAQNWELDLTGINVASAIDIRDGFNNVPGQSRNFDINENESNVATYNFMGNNEVTYSLSGEDAGFFNIDSSTGALSFKNAPDAENAQDDGQNNVYDIKVSAAAAGYKTLTRDVTVTVKNINEGGPVFQAPQANVNVAENSGTTVATFATVDPDIDDTTTYTLLGPDAALFNISNTGVLTFKNTPNAEAAQDQGADNVYNLTIRASDQDGLNNTHDVTVTVTNVNEFDPAFAASTTLQVNAAENQTAVATVAATDQDFGETITYSLSGADAALFSIDVNGVITFNAAPDAESHNDAGANGVYDLTVTASDGTRTATRDVEVTLTDVNEFNPTWDTAPNPTIAIDEGQTAVASFAASDQDRDGDIQYSLTGDDAASFSISNTGALTFNSAPDADAPGAQTTYNVTIVARDGVGAGANELTHDLTININNINDNTPTFASNTAINVDFDENQATATVVATAAATDADAGTTIIYTLEGPDAARFNINTDGEITFVASPDAESAQDVGTNNIYNITVRASDGVNSATRDVIVNVQDLNDNNPTFDGGLPTNVNVAENSTGTVATFGATDADTGATLSYSLTGDDAADFTINASGELEFVNPPNFEAAADANTDNVYNVTINVSDGANSATPHNVTITVTNVDEGGPAFADGANSNLNVNEGQAFDRTFAATDPDGGNITYALSGDDAGLFTLNTTTGQLEMIARDHETPADNGGNNVYNVTITATGTGAPTTHDVTLTVNDVNDNAPVFDIAGNVSQHVAIGSTNVGTWAVTDADDSATITYSLAATGDAGLFNIDSNTGAITYQTAPTVGALNDVHNIRVVASDGANTVTKDLTLTVARETDGTPGNNSFTDEALATGAEIFNGEAGIDTLILDGVIGDYTFAVSGDNLVISETGQANNVNFVTSIETLQFTGGGGSTVDVQTLDAQIGTHDDAAFDTWLQGAYDYNGTIT